MHLDETDPTIPNMLRLDVICRFDKSLNFQLLDFQEKVYKVQNPLIINGPHPILQPLGSIIWYGGPGGL
jgi:hypothetical protein